MGKLLELKLSKHNIRTNIYFTNLQNSHITTGQKGKSEWQNDNLEARLAILRSYEVHIAFSLLSQPNYTDKQSQEEKSEEIERANQIALECGVGGLKLHDASERSDTMTYRPSAPRRLTS